MRATILIVLALGACTEAQVATDAGPDSAEDAAGRCGAPPHVTYSCDPLPNGERGCRGAPRTYPVTVFDDSTGYPMGCTISLPFCHPRYPDDIATCDCGSSFPTFDAGTDPEWICPA